ncbi:unnamed protein product [Prorocentrum cordatum]|uniref:Uncharacterized protein n=1 Tax=Prorocentrum cordatum TaxID=2364126 RepID=A0ABN9X3U1_9DINO|nr:unnamed protein product [Polarella glacialis]
MVFGSSSNPHISPSTDNACCHCPPFAHALIPALWQTTFCCSLDADNALSNDTRRTHNDKRKMPDEGETEEEEAEEGEEEEEEEEGRRRRRRRRRRRGSAWMSHV